MDYIVTDLTNILKQNNKFIIKEANICVYLFDLIAHLLALAIMQLDDELVEKQKAKGYVIEKMSERTMMTMVGEIRFKRRRYIDNKGKGYYAVDDFLGFEKYCRYTKLVIRNLCELSTSLTYRNASKAIELFAPFNISHQKINKVVNETGKQIQEKQEAETKVIKAPENLKKLDVLYVEGDAFWIKGQNGKWFEMHRYQVCEGTIKINKTRNERINSRDFVSPDRKNAQLQLQVYLHNTYDLKHTIIISNGDGGAGYNKQAFEEMFSTNYIHEYFLDSFHVNQKIKNRISFLGEISDKLIRSIWCKYDYEEAMMYLDTAESMLVNEVDTVDNHEQVSKLRAYLIRNWEYIKPIYKRANLKGIKKAIGGCESNHRKYTYRMKRQGRYWTKQGAQSMCTIIAAIKNKDLDYWVELKLVEEVDVKEIHGSVRKALKKAVHEVHTGVKQGVIRGLKQVKLSNNMLRGI